MVVNPADVQNREGAEPLLRQARRLFPFVERIIGDAGYQGPKMAAARPLGDRDRAPPRSASLRCAAKALDRRADARPGQPSPPTGTRLRMALPYRRRVCPDGQDPHHVAMAGTTAFNVNHNIWNAGRAPSAVWPHCERAAIAKKSSPRRQNYY
jgi:hypothetical protein